MIVGVSAYSFAKHMKATGANCFQIADLAKQMGFDAIEYTGAALETGLAFNRTALEA